MTLHDSYEGWPSVLRLDEQVAVAAPFPACPVQVGLEVQLVEPGLDGLPSAREERALHRYESALVDALGDDGRLVAVITLNGVREYLAYVSRRAVVEGWRERPPPGLATHDAHVQVLEDPTWLGLREVAGLLDPDEQPLRAPDP